MDDPPPTPLSQDPLHAQRSAKARSEQADAVQFGEFRLDPASRLLTKQGSPVKIGARALDLLIVLASRAGSVVSKNELFAAVWPDTAIEESNLRVNIAALRKALGESGSPAGRISSVPGRGYLFTGAVSRIAQNSAPATPDLLTEPGGGAANATEIVVRLVRIFGRNEDVASLARDVTNKRLVTITGPGGIGKTSAALAVADRLTAAFEDGLLCLDLAAIEAGRLIAALLASHLRLSSAQSDTLSVVVGHLRSRQMLVLFDNCEHVVGAVATVVSEILREAPGCHILATSREPLRVQGEFARRLAPLAFPAIDANLAFSQMRQYPAVQLLEERVRSCDSSCHLSADDIEAAVAICTKLDGLPLAIELAAARVPALGWSGVVSRLDRPFRILNKGFRTATARHQSLRSLIDWSYETLPEPERNTWMRLAVFRNGFDIEAAYAVANTGQEEDNDIVDVLHSLVEKSLVSVDLSGLEPKYHLLESLRLYAWERLSGSGEVDLVQRRHAEYWLRRSAAYGDNWIEMPSAEWLACFRDELSDVRAAIEWSFSASGDAELGIRLVAASAPLWFKLLLLPELTEHLERAISRVTPLLSIPLSIVMRLHIALAHSIFHAVGPVPEVGIALDRALVLADQIGDSEAQCQIVWAQFGHYSTLGDYHPMMQNVERARSLAATFPEPIFAATYDRIAALGFHLLGEQDRARQHGLRALNYAAIQRHGGGFVYDHQTASSSHLCRVHWIMGERVRSRSLIHATIDRAVRMDQPFAFGYFLAFGACPVSIWSGDLAALRSQIALLTDTTIGIPRTIWRISGEFYQRVLDYLEELPGARKERSKSALLNMPLTQSQAERLITFQWELLRPEVFATPGSMPNWCSAEVMRAQGEAILSMEGNKRACAAEALFQRALEIARTQKAASWELRAATSLARLRAGGQDSVAFQQARLMVADVVDRIDESIDDADLVDARTYV